MELFHKATNTKMKTKVDYDRNSINRDIFAITLSTEWNIFKRFYCLWCKWCRGTTSFVCMFICVCVWFCKCLSGFMFVSVSTRMSDLSLCAHINLNFHHYCWLRKAKRLLFTNLEVLLNEIGNTHHQHMNSIWVYQEFTTEF